MRKHLSTKSHLVLVMMLLIDDLSALTHASEVQQRSTVL